MVHVTAHELFSHTGVHFWAVLSCSVVSSSLQPMDCSPPDSPYACFTHLSWDGKKWDFLDIFKEQHVCTARVCLSINVFV